jgi:hypothetical protein
MVLRRAIENRKCETRQAHRSPEEDEFRQPAAMLEEIEGGVRIGEEGRQEDHPKANQQYLSPGLSHTKPRKICHRN